MTTIDKIFIFVPLTYFCVGYALYQFHNIRARIKRKRAAQNRLRVLRANEEYELATARFRDPHYYGD